MNGKADKNIKNMYVTRPSNSYMHLETGKHMHTCN